jgi:hypothetical protein
VKYAIARSRKTLAEPKAKSKKMSPTDRVEVEEKAKAEVEGEPRPKKGEETLGRALPKDITDTHLLPFPRQAKKPVEDEKFSRIQMLDAMQVPTYARYLKDILN